MIFITEGRPTKISGKSSLYITFTYNTKIVQLIKSCSSFSYDSKTYTWEVPVSNLSYLIDSLTYIDDIKLKLLDANKDLADNVKTVVNYKSKPFGYQMDAIKYGLCHDKWMLLDAPGLGKSIQTICLAEELKAQKGVEHCLIVCGLNSLKTNWKSEIAKHSNLSCRILGERVNKKGNVTYASVAERAKELEEPIDEFFIITNIESFGEAKVDLFNKDGTPKLNAKGQPMTKATCPLLDAFNKSKNKIDMIVIDEVHKCKDPTAQRTSNFIKLESQFKLAMTGTLLLNNPLDAYVALKWTENDHSTWTNFKSLYCEYGGFGGHEIIGYKNLNILKDEIESCSLRRTKDILKVEGNDLPPRTFVNEYVDMDKSHKDFYDAVKKGVKEEADLIELKANNLLALVTRLRQATACPQLLTSKGVKSSKVDRAIDLIEQIVGQNEKVVVFSTFKEPIQELAKELKEYKPLVATGDTKDNELPKIIDSFKTDISKKILLATWQKMGTGLTLTEACYMIFIDTPWTYSVYSQACDRIYRIGQTKPVTVYNLMCVDTIDERVQDILETKKALAEFVIDDKIESESDMDALRKIISDL